MKICGIYKITHKETGKSYIGLSVDIHNRWKQHRSFAKTGRKSAIYSALKKYGVDAFEFTVLEECASDVLEEREKHWIVQFDTVASGYNLTFGGESNKEVSEETRRKISEANTGKKRSPESIAKFAQSMRGQKRTPEQNAAKSALMKGRGLGRKLPPEVVAKIGKPFLGRKHSDESKAKMSAAKKGTKFSDDHIQKLKESHTGYKFSDERKAKHSEALKRYWAQRKAQGTVNGNG